LSESGYPGFEDLQDFFDDFNNFDWGEIGICLNQDIQDLRIYRIFLMILIKAIWVMG
jgi:hypothetical protein